MIEKLERLVDEVGALQSKLVLLIGPPNAGKTARRCACATAEKLAENFREQRAEKGRTSDHGRWF